MTRPLFSLLHASFGRPAKAIAAMTMWLDRASQPDEIEYIMAVNEDDPTCHELLRHPEAHRRRVTGVMQATGGSASAWDAAARVSTGQILVQVSDDFEPCRWWDQLILDTLDSNKLMHDNADATGREVSSSPFFVRVSDGFRRDGLMTMAICNRGYAEMQGEFISPEFFSVFSDDDYSIRAYGAAADGKAVMVDAPDILMLHRHAYHDKTVPLDQTYLRQNSSEAYARGGELFMQRNGELVKRGFKTW